MAWAIYHATTTTRISRELRWPTRLIVPAIRSPAQTRARIVDAPSAPIGTSACARLVALVDDRRAERGYGDRYRQGRTARGNHRSRAPSTSIPALLTRQVLAVVVVAGWRPTSGVPGHVRRAISDGGSGHNACPICDAGSRMQPRSHQDRVADRVHPPPASRWCESRSAIIEVCRRLTS
jgi:hypothetical protein